jgi:hypothetical protein
LSRFLKDAMHPVLKILDVITPKELAAAEVPASYKDTSCLSVAASSR